MNISLPPLFSRAPNRAEGTLIFTMFKLNSGNQVLTKVTFPAKKTSRMLKKLTEIDQLIDWQPLVVQVRVIDKTAPEKGGVPVALIQTQGITSYMRQKMTSQTGISGQFEAGKTNNTANFTSPGVLRTKKSLQKLHQRTIRGFAKPFMIKLRVFIDNHFF